jgi:succinyl-diaminopimelate desuccinylase
MLKQRLIDELTARQADLFALCSRLVQIPSENPPGDTTRLASFIRDYLVSRGIEVAWHEPSAGRPNLVAKLGSGGPNLVLSGHLDEFPAGQGWARPPFSGAIEDGRIWGRGAGDMKAGLAVALTIASLIRGMEVPLAGTLTLAFASDEETGGAWGTQWLLANVAGVRGDACLIGESSGTWSAGIGEKGVLWLRLRASGVSGHAAYQQGTSAVGVMRGALGALDRLHGRRAKADAAVTRVISRQRASAERRWGRGTGRLADTVGVSVGTLQGGGQVNLIPEAAMAEVDMRVPPGLTTAAVEKEARRRIKQAAGDRVEVEVFNQCDPYVTPPDSRLVTLVLDNARTLNRQQVLRVVRLGYTDGRFFRRAGIPTVVYGPAVQNMGGPDECIETADLLEVARVHAGAVLDMLAPGARP